MADVWNKYANTAARKHGKPGREVRPTSLTLDMHSHVAVPRVAEIVTPHLKQSTDPLVADSTPDTRALMAKQAADIRTRIGTTDERFAVMDEMGVDMQLICPTPPQIYYYWSIHLRIHPPPKFVIDISDVIDEKMRAVACYESQFGAGRPQTFPTAMDDIRDRARYWGWAIHKAYGEPFASREDIGVSGLGSLL